MRAVTAFALLLALTGCGEKHALAKAVIGQNCAACHTVPGVAKARANVGPSLARIASRQLIAGRLPNNRANMLRWITRAQSIEPGTAMPDVPLTPTQADAVVDYLYTLD